VRGGAASGWAPLRYPTWRRLFVGQLTSHVGTWMQLVGAQWLMIDLEGSALEVALVQTAVSLPVVVLALPAGALGDLVDRRRVLVASQSLALAAALALAVTTFSGAIDPVTLLALTFAVGLADALRRPVWQAVQQELVPRELIPHAVALNSASVNAARAVGPAIGGVVVAAAGPGWVFAANAASFLAVLLAASTWRREPQPASRERLRGAIWAGVRYTRASPRMRRVLSRTFPFALFASALWALLPLVAARRLGLGSDGYGLLLGAVGVGALAGVIAIPHLRAALGANGTVTLAIAVLGVALAAIATARAFLVGAAALTFAGAAWIAAVSSLNASAQTVLPAWVRARGLAVFLLTLQGGQAAGAALWGALAEHSAPTLPLFVAASGLAVTAAVGLSRPVRGGEDLDLSPAEGWSEPQLAFEPEPAVGPVLVTVEYIVPQAAQPAFEAAMQPVGRARLRAGARRWQLFRDLADRERYVETFLVPSWEEYLQLRRRATLADLRFERRARALAAREPRTTHLVAAEAAARMRDGQPSDTASTSPAERR
jgi:MFS family permease